MTDPLFHQSSEEESTNRFSFEAFLHAKVQSANKIPFSNYMQECLYNSEGGYYSQKMKKVGKDGDFFTSVSVGKVFGEILAYRLHDYWKSLGSPPQFTILELGANDGQLAVDILLMLNVLEPVNTFQYQIVEPLESRRIEQQELVEENNLNNVTISKSMEEVSCFNGVFLSNELIDAFPVEMIRKSSDGWEKMYIQLENKNFTSTWELLGIGEEEVLHFIDNLPEDLPIGYQTEFRPGLHSFFSTISDKLLCGMILLIDYGFPHSHYYISSRMEGTLQTYHKHQATNDPLVLPGEQDITAHVDFTHLARVMMQQGFELQDFVSQQRYLTLHGVKWLKKLEETYNSESPAEIRQFQTLTMPTMMGQKFQVLEMIKNSKIRGESLTTNPAEILEL